TLYVGTFVGGLAQWNGTKRTTAAELRGENVTAFAPDSAGGLWLATRTGLWHLAPSGHLARCGARARFLDTEIQALCATPGGLWVGTRTGLFFLPTRQKYVENFPFRDTFRSPRTSSYCRKETTLCPTHCKNF